MWDSVPEIYSYLIMGYITLLLSSESGSQQTPVHLAAAGGHAECFNCLLNHFADPYDMYNDISDNAIDVARRNGHPQAINKAGNRIYVNNINEAKCPKIVNGIKSYNTDIYLPILVTGKIRCSQCVIKEKKLKAIEDSRPPEVIANILAKRTTVFDKISIRYMKFERHTYKSLKWLYSVF